MALTLVTPPVAEPLSVEEAKHQVLQGGTVDDAYLATVLIPAVRDRAELATQRALITQTWDLVLDRFPCDGFIEIPKPPLVSVTFLKYYDTAGTLTTWATTNYDVQAPAGPRCARGRLALSSGVSWPATDGELGDVTVRFVCGYGATGEFIPGLLRAAMLMDLAKLYEDRTAALEERSTVGSIYWSFRCPATQRRAA